MDRSKGGSRPKILGEQKVHSRTSRHSFSKELRANARGASDQTRAGRVDSRGARVNSRASVDPRATRVASTKSIAQSFKSFCFRAFFKNFMPPVFSFIGLGRFMHRVGVILLFVPLLLSRMAQIFCASLANISFKSKRFTDLTNASSLSVLPRAFNQGSTLSSSLLSSTYLNLKRVTSMIVSFFEAMFKVYTIMILAAVIAPFLYVSRLIFVLLMRWMKVHGAHGAPSVTSRQSRLVVLGAFFSIFALLIVARLFSLQGSEHVKWDKIASKQHRTNHKVVGARGLIIDRNGAELAVSIPSLSVGAHPSWIKDKEGVAALLAPLLESSENEILSKLSSDKSFIVLAQGLSQSKERDISALRVHGLELERDFQRVYPQGSLASTIIGKSGKDGYGLSGVERTLNSVLSASSLNRSASRDAKGRLMSSGIWERVDLTENRRNVLNDLKLYFSGNTQTFEEEVRKEGGNIALTIDTAIQEIMEEEFDLSKDKAKAKEVFGLMMDAETGEILGMAQTSRFDPNDAKGLSSEALRNVVLQNSYEPGSTFKPLVAAIALDKGLARYDEIIDCENGRYPIGKHTIRDAHPIPAVTFEHVLVRSSNIGMAKLAFRMGKDSFYNSLVDFGFGQSSNLGLTGESKGIMRHSKSWAQIDIATHSFGQGVSVTALQLVRAYGALANGGILLSPQIIKGFPEERKEIRVLKKATTDKIRVALNLVTEDAHGTGKNSRIPGVPVYGKTGTAQKARVGGKGYDPSKVLASFIGFVDGHTIGVKRTLVLYVAVDEPGVSPRWGGTLAAPAFKNVMERTLSYLLTQESSARTQMAKGGVPTSSVDTIQHIDIIGDKV